MRSNTIRRTWVGLLSTVKVARLLLCAFWKPRPRSCGTNTLLVPQPKNGGPVSPVPTVVALMRLINWIVGYNFSNKDHRTLINLIVHSSVSRILNCYFVCRKRCHTRRRWSPCTAAIYFRRSSISTYHRFTVKAALRCRSSIRCCTPQFGGFWRR